MRSSSHLTANYIHVQCMYIGWMGVQVIYMYMQWSQVHVKGREHSQERHRNQKCTILSFPAWEANQIWVSLTGNASVSNRKKNVACTFPTYVTDCNNMYMYLSPNLRLLEIRVSSAVNMDHMVNHMQVTLPLDCSLWGMYICISHSWSVLLSYHVMRNSILGNFHFFQKHDPIILCPCSKTSGGRLGPWKTPS